MKAQSHKAKLLPIPEAAERLGVRPATVRAWVYRNSIEFFKIGRSIRISEATIAEIVERGNRPARAEL